MVLPCGRAPFDVVGGVKVAFVVVGVGVAVVLLGAGDGDVELGAVWCTTIAGGVVFGVAVGGGCAFGVVFDVVFGVMFGVATFGGVVILDLVVIPGLDSVLAGPTPGLIQVPSSTLPLVPAMLALATSGL